MAPDLLTQLRAFPRDTTIAIEGNAPLAEALHAQGFHVVLVGAQSPRVLSVPTPAALNDMWSLVTCRNPAAAGLGGPELRAVVQEASDRSRVNVNTSNYRARGWARNFVRNLPRLTNPLAMSLRGLDGVPAFIVGAGASLDDVHHLLPECSRRGIVIAVNAAARLPGVDMALTVESNDLRHKLGPLDHVSLRAFGSTGDPAVMAHGSGALVPLYAGELGDLLASLCGVPKLACSGLGGTAAVALAERLGCDPIVLVGHDFEAVDGGLVYPACLGIGSSRTRIDGETVWFDWDESLRALPRHNPLNDREPLVRMPGVDGGEVLSTGILAQTSRWYANVATNVGEGTTLLNASGRGVAVPGWENWTLPEAIAALPPCEYVVDGSPGVTSERLDGWIGAHIRGIADVERACRRGDAQALIAALRFAPLVEPWCQAKVADVMMGRRSEPPSTNAWREWQSAKRHEADVMTVLLAELPDLVSELERARAAG